MHNKKMLIYSGTTMVIALLLLIAVFCVSPVKKISSYNKSSSNNSNSSLIKTPETVEFDKASGNLNVSFILVEKDLNDILYNSMKDSISVDGVETDISQSDVKVYINSYVLQAIPTQYILDFTPDIKNNTLTLNLKSAKMGRISMPKGAVLNNLKENASDYISVNKDNSSISIDKKAVAPFKITSFNMDEGKLRLNLNYQIKSITDITGLLSNNMPEGITNYVKKMFNSQSDDDFKVLTDLFK